MNKVELTQVVRQLENNKGAFFGWRKYTSTYRQLDAFYNKKLGLVLKRPSCILEPDTPRELCIPTIELGGGWVCQPIARKINLKAACEAIRKKLKKHPKIFPDVHTGNVGWYHNKPVLFDW